MLDISRHPYMELSNRVMTKALKLQAEAETLRPLLEAQTRDQNTLQQKRTRDQIFARMDRSEKRISKYLCQ